jgi:hypothetical protein
LLQAIDPAFDSERSSEFGFREISREFVFFSREFFFFREIDFFCHKISSIPDERVLPRQLTTYLFDYVPLLSEGHTRFILPTKRSISNFTFYDFYFL